MDLGFRELYFGVRLTVLSGTGAHQESQKNKKRKNIAIDGETVNCFNPVSEIHK